METCTNPHMLRSRLSTQDSRRVGSLSSTTTNYYRPSKQQHRIIARGWESSRRYTTLIGTPFGGRRESCEKGCFEKSGFVRLPLHLCSASSPSCVGRRSIRG